MVSSVCLKQEPDSVTQEDISRLVEIAGRVWRVSITNIRRGHCRRSIVARAACAVVLGETCSNAASLMKYNGNGTLARLRRIVSEKMDCPVDGARIHRLIDLVRAEMPHLLAKLVVPDA